MKKRAIALLLAASIAITLCGCSALFKKEYLSVSKYKGETRNELGTDVCEVKTYDDLVNTIVSMVNSHKLEGRIVFTGYDGNLQSDLAQACWDVKAKTAMGSYAVEYMSYDLSRIVTYYEAVIYITYKHSQADIENIKYVSGRTALTNGIGDELAVMNRQAAFRLNSSTVTAEEVMSIVETAYASNPASCVLEPEATVRIHPETGNHRIIEIDIEYGEEKRKLKEMKAQLLEEIDKVFEEISNENPAEFAKAAYNALAAYCKYDPLGELRTERGLDPRFTASAYGALVEKCADSRGIALAFSALCKKAGIECIVVNGSVDKQNHSWNIVKIGENYFHVDVSADSTWGFGNSFMKTDEQMQSRYWWNIESYPECGDKTIQNMLTRAF